MNFSKFARRCSDFMGSSKAFAIACAAVLGWIIVAGLGFRFNETSQLPINTITTIITFLSVFLIQHAQNHDTKAMNEKLDELIIAIQDADNQFVGVEQKEIEVLEELAQRHEDV